MSAISPFGSSNTGTSSANALSSLSSDEFLQIIFTELSNQDPLSPNDTSATLDQLSTLMAIESDTQMVESLSQLVGQNELTAASSLIGSLVVGTSLDNRQVADLVISVSMTQDGPVLNLFDGSRMFFNDIIEIVGPIDDINNDDDNDDPPIDDNTDDDDDDDVPMGNTDGGPAPVVKTVDPGDVTPNTNQGNSVDPQPRTVSNDV
jgi:flagellar basal-body rod modification protein FlgD